MIKVKISKPLPIVVTAALMAGMIALSAAVKVNRYRWMKKI